MTEHKLGRPTIYSEEFADRICKVISESPEGDRALSKKYDWFPHVSTLYEWKQKYSYFSESYSRAKKNQIEVRMEHIEEELSDDNKDFHAGENGKLYQNNVRAQRLRIWAQMVQWRASKLLSNKYGDKVQAPVISIITPDLLKKAHDLMEEINDRDTEQDHNV